MKVAPTDDIFRVKFVYFGPDDWTFPWQWTFGRYGLFLSLSAVSLGVVLLLTGFHFKPGPDAFAVAAAVLVSAVVWKRVNPDRPARAVVRTVLTDWRHHPKPGPEPVRLPTLSAAHITITTEESP